MYLRKSTNKKTGRTYLSVAEGYWDKNKGYTRTFTVKPLGFIDELQSEFPDPISHFKAVIAEMNQKKKEENTPFTFSVDKTERLASETRNRKNFGYAALSKIYHELEIDTFFTNRARGAKMEYIPNSILKLLVFERILNPGSKKQAYENRGKYFENNDFSLDDVYNSLTFFQKHNEAAQARFHQNIIKNYGRKTDLIYYDVTNYYFEIDEPDELRKKGVSKEHRPDPIVQMGLCLDTEGIPMCYKLFSGNTNDCETLAPIMKEIKREYEIGRAIVVADKGLNTSNNIAFNILRGDGYVYSQTVRGGNAELKKYVLEEKGYTKISENYKIKSRLYPREISVTDINGKRKTVRIDEKQVIFWSGDYSKKAKAEREPAIQKARDLVKNPSKYRKATAYGAAKYVDNIEFDKKTGEILTTKSVLVFNEKKLREEEKWDGYYAIVTSEMKKSDNEIIGIYRGLWRIEETFKVTKSALEARPVYVSRTDHIEAHFLICFIALTILRLLQKRLENKFSAEQIAESLRKSECSYLQENYYLFDYCDEALAAIGSKLGIDFGRKYMRLNEIKNILSNTKNISVAQ
jgi:transposase